MIQIARYYWRSRFTGQLGRGEDVSRRGGRDGEQAARGGGGIFFTTNPGQITEL
jgi:hypothetical protein